MENLFCIQLAGQKIGIAAESRYIRKMCADYAIRTDQPDFIVEISPEDLENELRINKARNTTVVHKNEGVLESLAVYRKIAEKMIDCNTLLFHGSAIAVDGQGYLFCADSGTGKSTHARLWREYLKERAVMINDDKPLVRVDDSVRVYGTPWSGKHYLDTNTDVPLKAVCFLERGEENIIHPVSKEEALPKLLRYSYRSADPQKLIHSMDILKAMLDNVKMYSLSCNMDPQAAVIAYEYMSR